MQLKSILKISTFKRYSLLKVSHFQTKTSAKVAFSSLLYVYGNGTICLKTFFAAKTPTKYTKSYETQPFIDERIAIVQA